MHEDKRIKIWQWAVVALVLCNIALIITLWLKPQYSGPPERETPREYVIRSLKFSHAQIKKYDVLIRTHQQAMHELRQQAQSYRKELFAGLKMEGLKNNVKDSICYLIAKTQGEIEVVNYDHFAQVRALCTDEQKTEFDNIIGDVIKKMNGGPPPHNRHGPPPGDEDAGHPPPNGDEPPPPPPSGL